MRYLATVNLESVLRRGKPIEQFLGGLVLGGERFIHWLELRPANETFELWRFVAPDVGDEENLDFYEFIGDEEGELVLSCLALDEALSQAQAQFGASCAHWANQFVSQNEYRDFVVADRPKDWRLNALV